MSILREYRDGEMDKLRSLKYGDSNTKDPYVQKEEGFEYNQINARTTDLDRFTKLLKDKPGLKFQGNQALLQQVDTAKDLKKAARKPGGGFNFKGLLKEVGKKALSTAAGNVGTTASILAQIPVNGTGTHFIKGMVPNGYLRAGGNAGGLAGFLGDLGIGGGVNGAAAAINGDTIPTNVEDTTDERIAGTTLGLESDNTFLNFGAPDFVDGIPIPTVDNIKDKLTAELAPKADDLKNFLKPGEGNTNQDLPINVEDKVGSKIDGSGLGFQGETPEYLQPGQGNTNQQVPIEIEDKSQEKLDNSDFGYNGEEPTAYLKPGEGNTNQEVPIDVEDTSDEKIETSTLGPAEPTTHLKKLGGDEPLLGHAIVQSVQKTRETDPTRKAKIVFDNLNQRPITQFQVTEEQDAALRDKPSVHSMDEIYKYQLSDGKSYLQSPLYIQSKYGLGDHGNRTNSGPDLVNKAVEQATQEALGKDLIPFYIHVIKGTSNESDTFIQFRAMLDSFDDSYTGNWSGTKYVGRAEEFYTYSGFSRSISLSFKLAAFSRAELTPLYKKLNRLVGTTAPTYNAFGSFMRGTVVSMKVGDYLDNTKGVINSVNVSWQTNYPWEIDAENLDNQKLPHILDISIDFTPIHEFNVKTDINLDDEVYIGRKGLPETTDPDPAPEPSGETFEFYSSGGTYTIDKATNKVVAVNGQPTDYVNGGFAYKANGQQAVITRVNGVDSEL